VIRFSRIIFVIAFLVLQIAAAQERRTGNSSISLSTSKTLTAPVPGRIGSTNSFPASIAVSPDGRYAALLNDGYGTQETLATQSIAVLDLKTNRLADYPDKRFGEDVHQSYFWDWSLGRMENIFTLRWVRLQIRRDRKLEIRATELQFTVLPVARWWRSDLLHRTTGARRGEKGRDRFAEDSGRDRDFLSGGAGADFQWWP